MDYPEELLYTKEHEWVLIKEGIATIGITDFAQDSLGDVVFLELPAVGDELHKDESIGVVESVKAVSDIFAPLSGEVVDVNAPLLDSFEALNEDPYGDGWMLKIRLSDHSEADGLLSVDEYRNLAKEET
ncbi:MAG: glycine cleavage system protein GcvH [Thermodesulfobacteriota bacterium]